MKKGVFFQNPFWKSLSSCEYCFDGSIPENFLCDTSIYQLRKKSVVQYAWAIPTVKAIQKVLKFSGNRLIEIGAGTGYWAWMMENWGAQISVVCYDIYKCQEWHPVLKGNEEMAGAYPHRTLFLCWPPYKGNMAAKAIEVYIRSGGKKIVYIGEDVDGCTGGHEDLRKYAKLAGTITIPCWPANHDKVWLYEVL